MKRLIWLAMLVALAVAQPAQAQLVGPGGGSGAAAAITFTNGTLPVGSASAASQCLQTNAGGTAVVLGACAGGGSFPAGSPPQIGGFSALNTSEAETVGGDATFTRTGANAYGLTVTKTNGTAFGAAATLGVGTGLTSTGGNITLTTPVIAANGGSGVVSPAAHSLLQSEGASAFTVITAATAGNIVIDQGAGVDWGSKTLSGDSTLSSAGVMLNLGLHFGGANAVALPTTAPTSGGIPYFSSAIALASSAVLTANKPVIGGGAGVAPSVGTTTGNTTAFATSTGALTSNDCAKWDASGNIVDAGAACGAGGGGTNPIFTHTITLSAGAATMSVQSSSIAAIDTDYVTLSANATITTPAAAGMADGQEIYLIGTTTGSAFTVGFTAGVGVTLGTIVLGDGPPFGTPAACGTIPATGSAWYKWKYSSGNTTLTLIACGINAPATSLAASLGGTGTVSPTAHALLMGEGSSAFGTIPAGTSGNIVIDQGPGADWLSKPVSGDSTLSLTGAMLNLALHFGAGNPVALPISAPTSGGIPYFSSTTAIASSALLTANLPVIGGGAGVAPTVGTVTGNTTKFATSTGTLTSGDCAKWDASGNIIDNGSTCGGAGSAPIFTHTLTEAGGAATLVVNSPTTPAIDQNYVALNANATITTPAAASMADGEQIWLRTANAGTAWTVTFVAGTSVNLNSQMPGDSSTFGKPAACGVIPATGSMWYEFVYSATGTVLNLVNCGVNAPPTAIQILTGGTGTATAPSSAQMLIAQSATAYAPQTIGGDATITTGGSLTVTKTSGTAFGTLATANAGTGLTVSAGSLNLNVPVTIANGGTAVSALSSWPIATNVNTSVGSATNITPSSTFWITNQDITMTASATLTIQAPSWANQMMNLKVCQNATGGFTPTFAAAGGLTITGTFPTCTTTLSKCCDVGLYFDSTSTAYITGSNAGPL